MRAVCHPPLRKLPGATLLLLLAGCQSLPDLMPESEDKVQQEMAQQPLKYLNQRKLKPMPVKPLTVSSQCSHKDEAGTLTRLKLKVKASKVASFNASIHMPQGDCVFDLKDFKQTATLPQVVLSHRTQADCTVRMWSQDRQVTIAYNACAQACTGDSFDYLWPTLVDSKTGRCD